MKKCLLLFVFSLLVVCANATSKVDTFQYNHLSAKTTSNIDLLTHEICNEADKDEKRVANIFYWVTHYIKIDVNTYNKKQVAKTRKPTEILRSKQGDAEDFAILVKAMCENTGIKCQVINGYEKNDLYENGAGFYNPNHTWNAVLVNNKWELLDAYNGAGKIDMDLSWMKKQLQKLNKKKLYTSTKLKFIQEYNPDYLFENPKTARLSKLPVDPIWQLTDSIMPLAIFEKTAEDIKNFNENYSEINKYNTYLSEVNQLNDNQQILECADRTYAFNPRYTEMKAKKHLALANKSYADAGKKMEKDLDYSSDIIEGKNEIKKCKEYLVQQKSEINNEYNELKNVNADKRSDVIKFKQTFTSMNTKFIAECKTKLSTGNSKQNSLRSENNAKVKILKTLAIAVNQNTKTVKNNLSKTEETKLNDSIQTRMTKVNELTTKLNNTKSNIELLNDNQRSIGSELNYYLKKSDSAFLKEAVARSKKQDSFDDSIKAIRSELYFYKTKMVDSTQKAYFKNYDSIINSYEAVKKDYNTAIELCKLNHKDLETLKRNDIENNTYSENFDNYKSAIRGFSNNNLSELNFINAYKPSLSSLQKKYESENKYFTYLVNTEDDRKNLVKNLLEKNHDIDKKRNEKNIESLKDIKEVKYKKKKKKS